MITKKKKAVDFICLQTYKNPLLHNNFNKLFSYILHYLLIKSKHTIECWW